MADDLELTAAEEEYFRTGDASAVINELEDAAEEQAEQRQPADTGPRSPSDFSARTVFADGHWLSKGEQEARAALHQEQLARARTEERLSLFSETNPGFVADKCAGKPYIKQPKSAPRSCGARPQSCTGRIIGRRQLAEGDQPRWRRLLRPAARGRRCSATGSNSG